MTLNAPNSIKEERITIRIKIVINPELRRFSP
jgi:hypothetical protein